MCPVAQNDDWEYLRECLTIIIGIAQAGFGSLVDGLVGCRRAGSFQISLSVRLLSHMRSTAEAL